MSEYRQGPCGHLYPSRGADVDSPYVLNGGPRDVAWQGEDLADEAGRPGTILQLLLGATHVARPSTSLDVWQLLLLVRHGHERPVEVWFQDFYQQLERALVEFSGKLEVVDGQVHVSLSYVGEVVTRDVLECAPKDLPRIVTALRVLLPEA